MSTQYKLIHCTINGKAVEQMVEMAVYGVAEEEDMDIQLDILNQVVLVVLMVVEVVVELLLLAIV